ncbi:ImmA/IrrE family metallo-endopeptidase [Thalassospira tepidiphila]|uniref:ImmA/IrrE family metallo-endopeptidase n=1 Tax=Thalassospira tepidiphila TaxID=393657 RepID=UPI003AA8C49F
MLKFAGDGDPVDLIQKKARNLVLEALQNGWEGPPYNPIMLAEMLGANVRQVYDVKDARTINVGSKPEIQFNPTQTRERVRFSVAHEVAHLLFPDVLEVDRYRGGIRNVSDEWQLEMLCNLAAAEFVIPVVSFGFSDFVPSIEELMVERRKYDVSAEAFLIRLVQTSNLALGVFCASPFEDDDGGWRYRVNYFIPSPVAPLQRLDKQEVPKNSALYGCTAIGYTDAGSEDWFGQEPVRVEYVGVPGYPGSPLPRVLGLVRFGEAQSGLQPVRYVHGSVLQPRGEGAKLVCQLVNDTALKWGGGVARQAARVFDGAESDFGRWMCAIPMKDRLGKVHFSKPLDDVYIASIVGQKGFGRSSMPRIRYRAIEEALGSIRDFALMHEASIHMPQIGTGVAGGNWPVIEEMIERELVREGIPVWVYSPPPKREQLELF